MYLAINLKEDKSKTHFHCSYAQQFMKKFQSSQSHVHRGLKMSMKIKSYFSDIIYFGFYMWVFIACISMDHMYAVPAKS